MTETRIEAFRKLSERYSLIRLKGKVPIETQWQQHCHKKRFFDEIGFKPDDNAGIACGPASSIIVVDIDDEELFKRMCEDKTWETPLTRTIRTGSGKRHLHYRYPDNGRTYGNRSFKGPDGRSIFDVRGCGGQIVAPGSIHPDTGRLYYLENDIEPAEAPKWLLDEALKEDEPCSDGRVQEPRVLPEVTIEALGIPPAALELIKEGKPKGERSEAIMTVLCSLVLAGVEDGIIRDIFEAFPIGEKYREKGSNREAWLKSQIVKAREFVDENSGQGPISSLLLPKGISHEEVLRALWANEQGDAELFMKLHRDRFRYDHSTQEWHEWVGHCWATDWKHAATAAVERVVDLYNEEQKRQRELLKEAMQADSKDKKEQANRRLEELTQRKKALNTRARRRNVLSLAAAGHHSLGIKGDEWDRDPWLLGCKNGVVDLRKGEFRAGQQKDYLTKISPVDWQALDMPCPAWEKFVEEIFDGSNEMAGYVQRLLGYSITGHTSEQILPILWGQGRNGKSTLLEVLGYILKDLAGPIQTELLLDQGKARSSAGPSADIMSLRGKRIVWASEPNEECRFSVSKVKWLVGGDRLVGRPPFGKYEIAFSPTHTLFLLTNHKPHASSEDYAFWQRIHLIPFRLSFVDDPKESFEKKRNPGLSDALKREGAGILAWLVRGCLEWQKKGLVPPKSVKDATREYRAEEDVIGQFIEERCEVDAKNTVSAEQLFNAYCDWCRANGHAAVTSTKFGNRVKKKFEKKRARTGMHYIGIGLVGATHPMITAKAA